jgi:mRNA-degrading endonuclease RelE of RelBE toxin-antitoxin system
MYKVTFSKKAIKALKKFPKENQLRIKDGVNKLSIDPFKMDLEKMHTSDATHRLRVGSYRLFLVIDTTSKEIIISTIKRRTTQTY